MLTLLLLTAPLLLAAALTGIGHGYRRARPAARRRHSRPGPRHALRPAAGPHQLR